MTRRELPAALADGTTRTRDECMADFGRVFAAARQRVWERYAQGGALAVAEAAHVPGGPSVAELAAGYEQLAQEARKRQEAA